MSGNDKAHDNEMTNDNEKKGYALTSEHLKDDVLDHIMANMQAYFGDEPASAERFLAIANAMNTFAHDIAKKSLANRQNLSPLKTLTTTFAANPDDAPDDTQAYELRYRLLEQYPDKSPHKDELYTLEEANEIYGEGFVNKYWGELGEHCPRRILTSDQRMLWFSTVRFPVKDQSTQLTATTQNNESSKLSVNQRLDNLLKM